MITFKVVQDVDQALSIATFLDDALGEGLHDPGWVAEQISCPTELVMVVYERGQMIGAGTASVAIEEEDAPNTSDTLRGYRIEPSFPLGMLESVALLPEYRGRGLGKRLAKKRLEWLKGQGCRMVVAYSWLSGDPHSSKPVLQKLGFREVTVLLDHWEGTKCPRCGDSCHCSASLMVLNSSSTFGS